MYVYNSHVPFLSRSTKSLLFEDLSSERRQWNNELPRISVAVKTVINSVNNGICLITSNYGMCPYN